MPSSLNRSLEALSNASPNTYCGVMVYHFFFFGSALNNGRTVSWIAPYVGTVQRKVEALHSVPVISSAPAGVMNTPPPLATSLPTASAVEESVQPSKNLAPPWIASCTLRTALPGLPSVSMVTYSGFAPRSGPKSCTASFEPISANWP